MTAEVDDFGARVSRLVRDGCSDDEISRRTGAHLLEILALRAAAASEPAKTSPRANRRDIGAPL